jgi:O-antigen ligase
VPPQLAVVIYVGVIAYFFRRDLKTTPEGASSLWLPSFFLLIAASRPLSFWINPSSFSISGAITGENSLLDTIFAAYFLIGGYFGVAGHKNKSSAQVSGALYAFLGYAAISLVWSQGGFHAVKQYAKLLGMVMMALMIAMEPDPLLALTRVTRRLAYVLVPVSFLYIKYFRNLGVGVDNWSGAQMYFGATESKNMLGQLCFITAFILIANLMIAWENHSIETPQQRSDMKHDLFLAFLSVYLLFRYSHSATSELVLMFVVALFFCLKFPVVRENIGTWLVSGGILVAFAQFGFELSASIAESFGRDPTLTNRTLIWKELLGLRSNSIIGTGYDGFWIPERMLIIGRMFKVNEAHNGYLEIFLNLGLIGVVLLIILLMSMYSKSRLSLARGSGFGQVTLALASSFMVYNLTEAGWKGQSLVMFLSLFMAVQPITGKEQKELSPNNAERYQFGYPALRPQ